MDNRFAKSLGLLGVALATAGCTSSHEDPAPPLGETAGSPGAGGSGGSSGAGGSGSSGKANGGSSGRGDGGTGGASGSGGTAGAGSGTGGASGGAGGTSSAGESGAGPEGGAGSDCGGMPCNVPADGLIDPARITAWDPGILSDELTHAPLGKDGIPVRTEVCAEPMPGDDLQAALDACPEGQVVELAAAEYTLSKTLVLTKGVVLRGRGSSGSGAGGTTLVRTGGGAVLAIGTDQDQACYASAFESARALSEDAVKETRTVRVSGADTFRAGDLALLDEADDGDVEEGDCQYFKREDRRSLSQRVEIASIDAASGTLTLTTPLHWTFRSAAPHDARIARLSQHVTRYAGIEGLYLKGGNNPGYNGQTAGGIDVSNAANSWIRDVQTDETIGGMHVVLSGTYRVVVRDSYFHHSADYGFGHDCYGIVLRCGAADGLVENNVVRYMNKPILFNVSGGGNVIGYNYADNSWATPPAWQEVAIDTHCSFPHMELMEGNYAPHMGATTTHGNAGYLTYFRNYSSSQHAPPAVYGSTEVQTGNVTAIQFDQGDIAMTLVGNVLGSSAESDLGTAAVSERYLNAGTSGSSIIELGADYESNVSFTTLFLHGNYDTVANDVRWDPNVNVRELPASLYLAARPDFWPAELDWPWAGADLSPRVGTLPAKTRADTLMP